MPKKEGISMLGSQHASALIEEIKRQSQPRRWPWQEKTIRDLLDERRSDLVDLALERSAQLTSAAAEQRNSVLGELQRQSQPRRWPWQEKTAYDKIAVRRERLAEAAVERANALSSAANAQRDLLLEQARRQSQPSRWPWQQDTLRDKFDKQRASLAAQTKPSRWPWQAPTLRDKFDQRQDELRSTIDTRREDIRNTIDTRREDLRNAFDARREELQNTLGERHDELRSAIDSRREDLRNTFNDVLPTVQETAADTARRVQSNARSTADVVQQQLAAAPQFFSNAADSLLDSSHQVANRIAETAGNTAASVKSAALAPVEAVRGSVESGQHAVGETVKAGRRRVKRSVRTGRLFLWALLIGGILGLLFAPRTGEETRRNLQALWKQISELLGSSK